MKTIYVFNPVSPDVGMEDIIDKVIGDEFNEGRQQLAIAFEEAFMNICKHAYEKDRGPAMVVVNIDDKNIVISLCDCGPGYDPVHAPVPDITEGQIGGHGLRLMHAYANMEYKRAGNYNILVLSNKASL